MAKSSKTAQEIVAEAKARLLAAEAKVAREAAQDNPTIKQLNEVLESLNGDINANSRLLNGPNSFENRLNAAQLRATWIAAQKDLIECQDNLLRAQKDALQHRINAISEQIAVHDAEEMDGELVLESVDSVLENLPQNDYADLVEAESVAKDAWKQSTPEAIRKAQQEAKQAPNNEASA